MPSLTLPNKALPRQSHEVPPQPISDFLELPWDVRRLIFEKVTTDIWRPMPFGCAGFYNNTKSIEVNILQVSCEVNAGASYSIQNSQADQPCVLAFNPLRHRDVPQAIFETISLARTYDEIYTNRVPKDQKPALAISPLAASLVFETLDCEIKSAVRRRFRKGLTMPNLSPQNFNSFITQILLQLRRKPEIELRLCVPEHFLDWGTNRVYDTATRRLYEFMGLTLGLYPEVTGKVHYRITIVSENKDIQEQLQAKWSGSELHHVEWEVATESDEEAWPHPDNMFLSINKQD
jgi:hypothetical protein